MSQSTYNPDVSVVSETVAPVKAKFPALVANRVAGLLAWGGVFVAAVLSYSHWADRAVPCGVSRGCDTVAKHESSVWFGVPVAMVGLAGYLALAVLSAIRPRVDKDVWRRLTNVSLAGTLFGFLASVYFMFTSVTVIKATCMWCVASALIMTASLIVTGWLWSCDDPDSPPAKFDTFWPIACLLVAMGATATVATIMDRAPDIPQVKIGNLTESDLLPVPAKIRGDAKAPVTVIEFADFNCPACRNIAPAMDKLYRDANGKIRWCFRNVPLIQIKGHETSMHAATLAELAASKNLFWDYFDNVYKKENTERVKSVDGLKALAVESGLKMGDITDALSADSAAAKGVITDMDLALKIGATSTPTFLILSSGQEPMAVSAKRLYDVLHDTPYKEMLWGR